MDQSFAQRYGPAALVTGASSGIGEQFARELAAAGLDLLLTARSEQALAGLAQELCAAHGVRVDWLACDLAQPADLRALCERAAGCELGLIVSNAGYGVPKGDFLAQGADALEDMYRVNALAPARLLHALLPALLERGRGGVICTGSIEGELAFPWSAGYAASKAFLHSLVLGVAEEVRTGGVDILLLAPGATDTAAPLKQGISPDQLAGLMPPGAVARQALARLGQRGFFIPGWHNRLMIGLLRLLPRTLATRLTGRGMRSALRRSAAGSG